MSFIIHFTFMWKYSWNGNFRNYKEPSVKWESLKLRNLPFDAQEPFQSWVKESKPRDALVLKGEGLWSFWNSTNVSKEL